MNFDYFTDSLKDGWEQGQKLFGFVCGFFGPLILVGVCVLIVTGVAGSIIEARNTTRPAGEEGDDSRGGWTRKAQP